ncbi:nitrous oxide reductase accessory protein NosL [Ferruginibacter lapsinanis]|uniref:nitrous oxide reductase accessory protein NosL n=1 Tax=Ferruginibacter lapsinanis TaxID=563172 RepID=UPI001E5FE2BC|nr:nitrous oxide reductase accessory protein NosL [Ferruginibacter lapsinanis]UEG50137.1 nitrous oxide reductase accessory protein NosL [Ferruginibacter lapsinanis]
MEKKGLQSWVRILLIVCGLALIVVLFVPLWGIDLAAPQYPEGLKLLIYPNKLSGNVDIINGLNHYIGMKTLHTEDFIEFRILPYIIGFFAAAFILVALLKRKRLLNILFILFVCFGILSMYDFWRWEYNYGHNLNPDAAIIVPGMAYQPPLIGFKQLLNFGAYSMPDIGGWIFVGVGVALFICVFTELRASKKIKKIGVSVNTIIAIATLTTLVSCSAGPEPLKPGVDNCHFCKMTISDVKFGAEIVTTKGKVYKFDDMHCVLAYLHTDELSVASIKDIFFTNFCGDHSLISQKRSSLLETEQLRSPMGGNIAAFDNTDSLKMIQQHFGGDVVTWNELSKK